MLYSNSKIYKLVAWGSQDFYVGSTTATLKARKCRHKGKSKLTPNTKVYKCFTYENWDRVSIVLLEAYPCNSKKELQEREQYWMDLLKPTLNTFCAPVVGRTGKQYRIDNADRYKITNKQYYEKNKKEINIKKKIYAEKHKVKIAEYQKQYRVDNAEDLKESKRQYYQKNKQTLIERTRERYIKNPEPAKTRAKAHYKKNRANLRAKVTCECGAIVCKASLTRHKKTNAHLSIVSPHLVKKPERVKCKCGAMLSKVSMKTHIKTKRHLDNI